MQTVIFSLPGNEKIADILVRNENAEKGMAEIRRFPDQETYIRILSDVKGKKVTIVCTLHEPDDKFIPLYYLSKTVKALGAASVCIVAPYLAYMRQDKVFLPGEGLTSAYFGSLISGFADALVTIDPHLHRRTSLSEIYSVPATVGHAASHISAWIKTNIGNPLLVGPDGESEQWVSVVAKNAGAPYIILTKIRQGDLDVEESEPHVQKYHECTPVIVDDIISTGKTMIETIGLLKRANLKPPVCIGVHAVFAGNSFQELKKSGAGEILTCNTIQHETNRIDISDLLVSPAIS